MSETATSIQDEFLKDFASSGRAVWIFLVNGIRLTGTIASADRHAVFVHSSSGTAMVYKHAIATMCEPYTGVWARQDSRSAISRDRRAPARARSES